MKSYTRLKCIQTVKALLETKKTYVFIHLNKNYTCSKEYGHR